MLRPSRKPPTSGVALPWGFAPASTTPETFLGHSEAKRGLGGELEVKKRAGGRTRAKRRGQRDG